MIKILYKIFLFTIVIFSSCNQNIETVNEIPIQSNPTENLETQSTFVFDEIFIDESSLDEWTEFKDSIHSGSISPSQMIQEETSNDSFTTFLAASVSTPSAHSRVSKSICPNNR